MSKTCLLARGGHQLQIFQGHAVGLYLYQVDLAVAPHLKIVGRGDGVAAAATSPRLSRTDSTLFIFMVPLL